MNHKNTFNLTGFIFVYGISQLLYGPLSDSIGRKPVAIFAVVLLAVGNLISALAGSTTAFLSGHVVAGVGAGGGSALSRAIIRDTHEALHLHALFQLCY